MNTSDRIAEKQEACLELRCWDPFGGRVNICISEMLQIMAQPRSAVFFLLAIASFIAFDALALRDHVSLPTTMVIWSLVVPFYVVLYNLLEISCAWGQRNVGLGRIYLPVVGVLAYAIAFLLATLLLAGFAGKSPGAAIDPYLALKSYPLALIFELIFYAFVKPVLEAALAGSEADAPAETTIRRITAGGESFALDSLLLLKSQEHYVQIVTDAGARRLRARLIDLVNQTDPNDGVLAHRSHWVARRAIRGFEGGHGSDPDMLLLVDGTRLPVAGPRRAAVRAWLSEHCPDLAQHHRPALRRPPRGYDMQTGPRGARELGGG